MAVVGEAADGLDACEQVPALRPDVVVMDVSMPGLTGAQATERLRRECPQVKVLALTVHEDKGYLRQLLAAGAAGYVLKRAAAEELIHAIRVVAAGGVYLDPALAGKVVGGFVRRAAETGTANGAASERPGGGGGPADRGRAQQQGDRRPARPERQDGGDVQGPGDGEARPGEPGRPRPLRRPAGLAPGRVTAALCNEHAPDRAVRMCSHHRR